MTFDLDTPEGRYAASQAMSVDAYNAAMKKHLIASAIEVVNGHAIRPTFSRFGRLFAVGTTGTSFSTLEAARKFAETA